ncbi:MAG: hypothetical protein ACI9KE_002706 [Polyangiales bacterium]|jgi:hypothetical protein
MDEAKDNVSPQEIAAIRSRGPKWAAVVTILVAALGFLILVAPIFLTRSQKRTLARLWRGEINLAGEQLFEPEHPTGTDGVPWREVHASLIPRWMVAQAHRPKNPSVRSRADVRSERAAQRAYTQLRYSLGSDQNLVRILDELEGHLRTDPVGQAGRIDYLLWAYNHYLDESEIPWRIEATMHMREDGRPAFYTRSYEVLEDLMTTSGRLRLVRRVDLTNIEEGFLGHTTGHREGALVMMDRNLHFAVQQVWPMLHAGLDERLPPELRNVAPFVREEAAAALPPGLLALLQETAVDDMALIEVADSIHARSECGSSFRVYGLPWNGLAPPDQRALVDALGRSQNTECPEVTLNEAARLIGASQRLGETKDLAIAVEYLSTWVAGAVSIHELRHVADGAGDHSGDDETFCAGCPEGSDDATRDELSAYLASFAAPGHGYLALAQACAMEHNNVGGLSAHAQALALAIPDIVGGSCAGPIPDDLYARSREVEALYFGARQPVELPSDFPGRLRLLR